MDDEKFAVVEARLAKVEERLRNQATHMGELHAMMSELRGRLRKLEEGSGGQRKPTTSGWPKHGRGD